MLRSLRKVKPMTNHLLYYERVLEHYENPRNVGKLDPKEKNVGTGLIYGEDGGVIRLQIKIGNSCEIVDAKFKTFGYDSAIAYCSYATEMIKGKNISDAMNMKKPNITEHIKLNPIKLRGDILTDSAIESAINDFKNKNCSCWRCPTISRCHRCGECRFVYCGCMQQAQCRDSKN